MSEGLSFDDVMIIPQYSEILPSEIDLSTNLTTEIKMNIPVVSAAMDTVTEDKLAIALAREGGIGVIHRNCSIKEQSKFIENVKRSESTIISDPVTVTPDLSIGELKRIMAEKQISGFPVVCENDILVGIITRRDIRFVEDNNIKIKDVMTGKDKLVTAKSTITMKEAKEILYKNRIEKLPLVDENSVLKGLITVKDIEKSEMYPLACKDSDGRLRVGGALGVGEDCIERAENLIKSGCDCLVIDAATAHTRIVIEKLRILKEEFKNVPTIAGNVVTEEGCLALIEAGASGIKVGLGPGSICTTRVISGVGVPQLTSIMNAAKICNKREIPFIADGGIRYSGDILKALACGASSVMIGSLFAGTEESPGKTIIFQGRTFKEYRGMGSVASMKKGSSDRYSQNSSGKLVPEGIEGRVPFKGSLSANIFQLMGGVKAGMGYIGAKNIKELKEKAKFIKVTKAGLKESHPHDVIITEDPLNYTGWQE
ncbi:MAG: IMP dehydrogenase [Candidatus Hydrogenedentota bacterium]